MRRLLLFFGMPLCGMMLAACYDGPFGQKTDVADVPKVNSTIGEVRRMYAGQSFAVTADIVVAGRVVTSDLAGNFYRTICIQDGGAGTGTEAGVGAGAGASASVGASAAAGAAAIEIMAGMDHLHNSYPVGSKVIVRLKGLTIGESFGVLQAGRAPAPGSGYAVDYIGSKAAVDAVLIADNSAPVEVQPANLTIAELTAAACGTLVRVEGVCLTPAQADVDQAPVTWAGYNRFTDDNGDEVYVYVRTYARFAGREVPTWRCALTGILQYDKSAERYIIKIRDEGDCVY